MQKRQRVMPSEKASKRNKADQVEGFVKAARELGCDDDEATFDKVLKKIASAPPPKSVQKRKSSRKPRSKG